MSRLAKRRARPRLEPLEDRVLPAVGLVAAFAFDEGTGVTVADTSGFANNGVISGATWSAAGVYGKALSFNGVNDWVSVADSPSLDLTTGMTLEAWVRPTTLDGWRTVFTKETGGGQVYQLYASNGAGPASYISTTVAHDQGLAGPALTANTWTHLASTYDGSTLRLYINGSLASSAGVGGSILTTEGALRIGGNAIWGEYYSGQLDEMRVYNRALSQSEIQQDMNTAIGTATSDTTPPTVVALTPADGAGNVSVASAVTVTFSEAIDTATLTASTFELRTAGNTLVPSSLYYDANTRTATLIPTAALSASASYTATVKGGISGVKDLAGNALAADRVWLFSTAAPPPGGFQQTTVISGLTNPTVVRFASDGRVFVAEKSGIIKVFDNLADTSATVFTDLRTNVYNAWDRGLLGMALAPDFASNPYVYVLYTLDAHTDRTAPVWGTPGVTGDPLPNPPGATGNGVVVSGRLSRIRVNADGTAGAEEILLDKQWLQQFPSHSIGALQFGPDGALYASAGDGASFNYVDYGQTPVNVDSRNPASMGDPVNEGGALRSQDLRSAGDAVTLAGTVIRINPTTGAAMPDNPLISDADANANRVIAYGLRNPFRFTFRPGTSEIWVGDVGWNDWEEINRIVSPTDATVENFGWPAYEGAGRQSGYDAANLPLLEALYVAGPSAVASPYYTYAHTGQVVAGSGEPTGGSSISGLAFYTGTSYPTQYQGALFFSDYSRNWVWAMLPGANGLPDPSNRVTLIANAAGPVNLEIGPNGDLFYVGFNDGTIRRLQYVTSNRAPTAIAAASPTAGLPPLTVQFDASASSDPDPGSTLNFAWDLDNDGQFDDSTLVNPTKTFATAGNYVVTLRVTDQGGLSDTDTLTIQVGNRAPTAIIDSPLATKTWQVGETITFAGHATDPDQGTLPAAALSWQVLLHHGDHIHPFQTFDGVAGGSFTAPDHEYPAYLELVLTATDAGGLVSTSSVRIDPKTVLLTAQSNVAGLSVAINGTSGTAPVTRTAILGSSNTLSAAPTQTVNGQTARFTGWSDGGAATHNITANATATYTATYTLDATVIGSDSFGYQAQTTTYQPIDLVPGAANVFTIRSTGNNSTNVVSLPGGTSFNFYGIVYTSLYVSTNGLITFGSGTSSASNTNLTSGPSQRTIAVLWDDWVNTSGNAMLLGKYEDTNNDGVPDRLIVEWNKVQGNSSSPSPVTFQAILSLNTGAVPGDIIFNYPDLDAGNSRSNGGSATVGIKDSGTQGGNRLLVSYNTGTSTYVGSGKAILFVATPKG